MRTDEIAPCVFPQPGSAERGDNGNEPINHDWQAFMRRAQKDARHGAQIEPADPVQNVNGIVCIRRVYGQCLFNDLFFLQKRCAGQSAAASRDGLNGFAAQRAQNSGGRRRVADAHFTNAKNLNPVPFCLCGKFHAGQNALYGSLPCHGRACGDVRCAFTETAVQNLRAGIGKCNAHVNDHQAVMKVFCQTRRAGQAARQVDGLRPRDRLRCGRNALADHAVVCRKNVNAGVADFIFDMPGDACQLDREVFQQTETSGRLCKRILPGFRLAHRRFVQWGNFGKQREKLPFILFHRVYSKRCSVTSQSRLGLSCISSSVHVACGASVSSMERRPVMSITPSKSAACRSWPP